MELETFAPRPKSDDIFPGDRFGSREALDRALIVLVREHLTGIKTKFNPEGGEAIVVDVADVSTGEVWVGTLWFNGAIVDNLATYVGKPVAVKVIWANPKSGGNPYLSIAPLEGQELMLAQQWAKTNPNRFDTERATRLAQHQAGGFTATASPTAPATTPTATATLPTVTAQAQAAPSADDIAAAAAQNPQVAALLAQLAAQNKAS